MVIFKRTSMTIGLLLTTAMIFADAKTHKIAFHDGESDPKVMNMTLNKAPDILNYHAGKGKSSLSLLPLAGDNR